jgi:hypothetical protein
LSIFKDTKEAQAEATNLFFYKREEGKVSKKKGRKVTKRP